MKATLSLLLPFFLTAAALRADPPQPVLPPQVRIDIQIVVLPKDKAIALLPKLHLADQIDAATGEIQQMIARKEAQLIAWPEVTTLSGQRATVEDIEEVRYAPEVPAREKGSLKSPSPLKFETRNTGITMEVSPQVNEAWGVIDLTLVPQQVRLLGWRDAFVSFNANGTSTKSLQPLFATSKVTTTLLLHSGQRCLLASFRVPGDDQQMELFILRAEILPTADKGHQPPPAK